MKLSRASLSELLFCIEWVLICIYFLLHPTLHNSFLTGLIWKSGFIAFTLRTLINIRQIKRIHAVPLAIIILILLFQCVSSGLLFSPDSLFSVSSFFIFVLHISNSEKNIIGEKRFDFAFYSCVFLAIVFSIFSVTDIAYKVTTNGSVWYTIYYVFNLDNPNMTGMYLLFIFSVLLINYPFRKHKVFLTIILIYLSYMIIRTNARMAILACLFVFCAFIFWGKKRIPQWVLFCFGLLPSLFVSFYLGLYHSGFENLTILGKSLFSGRQTVYTDYLKHMQTILHVFFGNLGDVTFSNAHNASLAIFCSIGAIGVVCFYYIVIGQLLKANRTSRSMISNVAIYCIMGIFLQACSEATMFLGGFPGVSFVSILFELSFVCSDTAIRTLPR